MLLNNHPTPHNPTPGISEKATHRAGGNDDPEHLQNDGVSKTIWRVLGLSNVDPARHMEQERLDRTGMIAALDVLDAASEAGAENECLAPCGSGSAQDVETIQRAVTLRWHIAPGRPGHLVDITYEVSVPCDTTTTQDQALHEQLEALLNARFEGAVDRRPEVDTDSHGLEAGTDSGDGGGSDVAFVHRFAVVSTHTEACFRPIPGQWSGGRLLEVRDAIDYTQLLQGIAASADPVLIEQRVTPVDPAFRGQLDASRRRWELQDRIQRQDERSAATRVGGYDGRVEAPRPIPRLAPTTNASRWPTQELQSVVERCGSRAVHLSCTVASSDRTTARQIATVISTTVFEPGTAQVVELTPHDPGEDRSVLGRARTLVKRHDAARLLAMPRLESPALFPSTPGIPGDTDSEGVMLGHRYDELVWQPTDVPATLRLSSMLQHVMVTGITGNGKSVMLTQIAAQCAQADPPIPVLNITLAKEEGKGFHRWLRSRDPRLRAFARELEIYEPNPDAPLPLKMNPFTLPGAGPTERADHAYRVIAPAVPQEGPLKGNLMEACDDLCHESLGATMPPVISDLPDAVRRVLAVLGYDRETEGNLGGAIDSRISRLISGLLGAMFRAGRSSPSIEDILTRPHCLSLGKCSVEVIAMVIVDLFLRLEQHLNREAPGGAPRNGRPRLAIIIDEAQVVAPRDTTAASPEDADSAAEALRLLIHAAKIFRAYRVALVLATQHPNSIATDLTMAVGTHIGFTQRHPDEQATLAGLLGLDSRQQGQVSGLPRGHAFWRGPGMDRAERIVVPFEPGVHDHEPLPDSEIAAHYANSRHARAATIGRCADELSLREARWIDTARLLRRHLCDLRSLGHARSAANSQNANPADTQRLLREIDQAEHEIQTRIKRLMRPFQRQWSRTLTPLPAWLSEWATGSKHNLKQKQAVEALGRRHDRLTRAYGRLIRNAAAARRQRPRR